MLIGIFLCIKQCVFLVKRLLLYVGDKYILKHAYLIIANKNPQQLQLLINTIDDSRNDIYLLIDAKSSIVNNIFTTNYSILNIINPIEIFWGSYTQIQAEINLFKAASHDKYGYYHLISGLDFPLVNQDRIHEFFDNIPNHEFLTYGCLDNKNEIKLRTRKHLFTNHFRSGNYLFKIYRKIENNILKISPNTKPYVKYLGYASNWLTIDHRLVQKIISNEHLICRMFYDGYLVDELFIPTIINLYPEFKKNIYYPKPVNDIPNEFQGNMRYINWWDGSPYVWRDKDYDKLVRARQMGHLFSRKFDATIDSEIIKKIVHNIFE